jgi:membrane protease YdiL (CAAX protease family)
MTIYETLSLMSVGAVLVGSAWAWSLIARRRKQGLPALDLEPAPPVPWSIIDVVIMLMLTFLINSILFAIAKRRLGLPEALVPDASPEQMATVIFLFSISCFAALLLTLWIVPMRTGATWRDLGVVERPWSRDITIGVIAFFALAVPVYLIQVILTLLWKETSHPLVGLLREEPTTWFFVMSAFSAVLVAPIVEEFFFRVLLQGWLETVFYRQSLQRRGMPTSTSTGTWRDGSADDTHGHSDVAEADSDGGQRPAPRDLGRNPFAARRMAAMQDEDASSSAARRSILITHPSGWAIVISALLFAIAHSGHGPDPIALFVLALGLGYVYQRTHRVLPCIVVHMMLNGLTLYNLWLYVHRE